MKKYIAECFGTFVLTFFGCGAAVVSGGIGGVLGVLGIALSFGLSLMMMCYVIGGISGCHINPAVSIAMLVAKKINGKEFVCYVVSQCVGAIIAAGLLKLITVNTSLEGVTLGANGYGALSYTNLSLVGALITEVVLTAVFVLSIFGALEKSENSSVAGVIIVLALAFVHIIGIPLTGTSVNPARSLGPALLMGGEYLSQVWVFIVAPLVGGVIAALVWKYFSAKKN